MGFDERPKGVDFSDIAHQSKQTPLYIHFQFGAYREVGHALLHTDVGKDWLDNAKPFGVDLLSLFREGAVFEQTKATNTTKPAGRT